MQFIELKEKLKHFPTFSIPDIRKIEEDFDIRRLSEWTRKGYIKKIRRGHYFFSDAEIREQLCFWPLTVYINRHMFLWRRLCRITD